MLRLCLLAALAAVCAATFYPRLHYGRSQELAGIKLSRYWNPRYCAPIRLRYPDISDLTCYYIVYYYVRQPPRPFISHLSLPGVAKWSTVPQTYWVQYLSKMIDLMPPVFYTPKPFYNNIVQHIGLHYPSIMHSSLYYDHLALADTYFCSNMVAPHSWNQFLPFYNRYILRLKKKRSTPFIFPGLPRIVSNLNSFRFSSNAPYFKSIQIKPLVIKGTRLVYPRQPIIKREKIWFPRLTLTGIYKYLNKRRYPWNRWYEQVTKITTKRRINWGSGYDGLVCQPQYGHLKFLCPAWNHGLLPVFRLRFASFPSTMISSQSITFSKFLSSFLYQWRPRIRVYSQSLVTSALLAFDNYACDWLGTRYGKRYPFCRRYACKSYKC